MTSHIKTIEKKNVFIEIAKDLFVALCGSFIISASGPISIYVPFTVVPYTIQMHVVLLVAFLLGKRRGPMAVAMFIMQGIMGYPVFAGNNAVIGIARVLGPTGGFILGYFIAALVVSSFEVETLIKNAWVIAAGNLTIYLFGALWLSTYIGAAKAVTLGLLPFVVTDGIKTVLTAKFVNLLRKVPHV